MKANKLLTLGFLLAACLGLIGRTIYLSPRQPMWLDETFTYYGLYQDSFADVWRALHTNVNATPPGYFLILWGVENVFPLSPLTLRLFSTLCACGTFLLMWTTLRRHTSFLVASVAAGTLLLTSELFLTHTTEARFYGLYLLAVAWAVYNFDLVCTKEPTTRRLVVNGLSHAAALSVMYLAGLYCAGILVALVLRDRLLKVWRPRVYLSVLLGWIPVLFYLPFFFGQKGEPTFIAKFGLLAGVRPFEAGINTNSTYFTLAMLAVLLVLAWLRRPERETAASPTESPLHLAVLALVFLAVPYGILAISVSGVAPVLQLLPRYCLPSLLGLVLLFGLLGRAVQNGLGRVATEPAGNDRLGLLQKLVAGVLLAGLVSWPVVDALAWAREGARSEHPQPDAKADPSFIHEPPVIATCDPHTYFVRCFNSHEDQRIFYVLTKPADYEVLHRYQKRVNPILLDDFLAKYPRFAVVSDDPGREWLEAELQKRGGYVIEREQHNAKHKWLIASHK